MARTDRCSGIAERISEPASSARFAFPEPDSDDEVAAYSFWQERGCPSGSDQEDWFRAEQALSNRT